MLSSSEIPDATSTNDAIEKSSIRALFLKEEMPQNLELSTFNLWTLSSRNETGIQGVQWWKIFVCKIQTVVKEVPMNMLESSNC